MSLVALALFMGAVTYPSRAIPMLAPGLDRLPPMAFRYLRLVGPAVLAALAAVNTFVVTDVDRHTTFHVGIEWLAVGLCVALVAWRKNLFLGLIAAVALAAIARAFALA